MSSDDHWIQHAMDNSLQNIPETLQIFVTTSEVTTPYPTFCEILASLFDCFPVYYAKFFGFLWFSVINSLGGWVLILLMDFKLTDKAIILTWKLLSLICSRHSVHREYTIPSSSSPDILRMNKLKWNTNQLTILTYSKSLAERIKFLSHWFQ